ncbi:MAG TPA: transposase [Terriglobales bacterium]|nr:transposase [Terriglobales bacterium]
MAEVGLLPFARIALQVAKAVLPRYRSRFSKHQFTQPQLLAILCLMRYEDWTFREAEVRLGEHRELRQALGLTSVPDFTTLYRFLQRLDDQTIDQAVGETVRRLRGTRRKGRRRARVGVDATGLAQGAVSTFFVRRLHHHGQKPLPWRHWLKWVVVADLDQQFLLSQTARRGPWNDCANLPAVVQTASQQTRIGLVLADAEFDSERNHIYIRKQLGAHSVIPAKRGKKTWRVRGVRAEMRRAFPSRIYRRRALIESVFSSVKRKLSARAPGRSLSMQVRQALLLGLSFNLYRLRHRHPFLRMSTEPSYVYTPLTRSLCLCLGQAGSGAGPRKIDRETVRLINENTAINSDRFVMAPSKIQLESVIRRSGSIDVDRQPRWTTTKTVDEKGGILRELRAQPRRVRYINLQ